MTDLFNATDGRRHEIDWLRSLAFILLIFYHIGMFYVADWGWHVKSEYQSTFLQSVMLMVNPWRMALIFFLSGFALCLVEPKIALAKLIKIRFLRIFVPLLFGIYTILIPQPYFEAVQNHGYNGGFWQFAMAYINPNTKLLPQMHHGPLGLLTWNHLWYLVYLWHYTLVYIFIKPILQWAATLIERSSVSPLAWFFMLVILITIIELTLEPIYPATNALIDDWYNHARYFVLFVTGYLLAKSPSLYAKVISHRWYWIAAAGPLYLCAIVIHQTDWFVIDSVFDKSIATFCLVSNALCWLFSMVALCGRYLTKPNRVLNYMNEAVLPWYILHQTVIIVLAMNLASWHLGRALEPLFLVVGTVFICCVLYELIRRWNVTRFLFGMKLMRSGQISG